MARVYRIRSIPVIYEDIHTDLCVIRPVPVLYAVISVIRSHPVIILPSPPEVCVWNCYSSFPLASRGAPTWGTGLPGGSRDSSAPAGCCCRMPKPQETFDNVGKRRYRCHGRSLVSQEVNGNTVTYMGTPLRRWDV